MKYKFVINDATEPPTRAEVEFRARTEERAYQFVIRHIIQDPRNGALLKGTLHKLEAFGWEQKMTWTRKVGWVWEIKPPPGAGSGMVDGRIAPGA